MLFVDTRWDGAHGIGRFSREVTQRLERPWQNLGSLLSPSSPLDAVNPIRLRPGASDLIYSPGYNAGLSRARQAITLHDMIHLEVESESSQLKRLYYDRLLKPIIKRAGMVFTVSETSRRAISGWLGDDAVNIVNVGNGCSDAFTADGPVTTRFSNYFLYVGNLRPHKNFDVVLRALALRPDYELVVVCSEQVRVRELATAAGVAARLHVISGVSDEELAELYRGSHGLVFPSTLEGFGLPAVEALSCGVSVAYWSGCESVAEIVGDAGPAMESSSDAEEWAAALDEMAAEPRIGAVPRIASGHSWDSVASRVILSLGVRSER